MATLPEQIRKQTEAVQEHYKQMTAGTTEEAQSTGADEVTDTSAEETTATADENYATNTASPSAEDEQKPADEKAPEETILQKYRTLQGMYNAEVPRLHSVNKELTQRVQQMEQLLASLSTQQASAAERPAQPAQLVTPQDMEDYGDSIDVMRRVSREELGILDQRLAKIEAAFQQIQTNVVPQVQAVAQRQAVSAEQQFWSDLTSAVPNWRTVNDDQSFQTWLLDVDPLTGISRQTYLEDAQRSLDANRVANFFRTWLEITGQAAVAQSVGSTPRSNTELEKQVSPGKSRSAGTPQSNKGKVYTPDDIRRFFDDVRSGKFTGREQERARIERDIFAAQRENRIQVNA